jgi:uncharacterized membrane protein (UPF0182 family)
MEPSLDAALQRIFGGRVRTDEAAPRPAAAGAPPGAPPGLPLGLIQKAWEAHQKGQDALRRGDWAGYGQEQKRLEEALRELAERR